jgi:hypothetical protein
MPNPDTRLEPESDPPPPTPIAPSDLAAGYATMAMAMHEELRKASLQRQAVLDRLGTMDRRIEGIDKLLVHRLGMQDDRIEAIASKVGASPPVDETTIAKVMRGMQDKSDAETLRAIKRGAWHWAWELAKVAIPAALVATIAFARKEIARFFH